MKHVVSTLLSASLFSSTLFAAAPTQRDIPAPSGIEDLEESISDALTTSPDFQKNEKRSIIEEIEVDESARSEGENRVAEGVTFQLNGVRVVGNTVMAEEEVVSIVQPYVGKQIASVQLKEIAAKITQLFVGQGYVTSACIIPEQKVKDGVVVLQVVEDRLGQILLGGDLVYRYESRLFMDHLHDLRGEVIHLSTLNSRLRLLTQLPATRVVPKLIKRKGGTTDLVLNLQPLEDVVKLSVNNSGSRFTGQNRLSSVAVLNNFTGNSDVLSMGLTTSLKDFKHLGSFSSSYKRPVGSRGGKLSAAYSKLYYRMDPDEVGYDEVRYEGDSSTLSLRYEEPFWLDEFLNGEGSYRWSVGGEWKDVSAQTIYNTTFDQPAGFAYVDAEDNLFVGDVTLHSEYFDQLFGRRGFSAATFSVKHAFEGFFDTMTQEDIDRKLENVANGVEPVTGPIGDVSGMEPDFWKLYLDFTRIQSLPYSLIAKLDLHGEYTGSKKLPQAYQFSGADGGAYGHSLSLNVSRPLNDLLWGNRLIGSLGYQREQAYSWYRDADPGCEDESGVAQATAADKNRCTTDTFSASLGWAEKEWSANLSWVDEIEPFDQNQEQLRLDVGYQF